MKSENEETMRGNNENYWVYLLTCLVVMAFPIFYSFRGSVAQVLDFEGIIVSFVKVIITGSFAWWIGKKYRLRYLWRCGLGSFLFFALILLPNLFYLLRTLMLDYDEIDLLVLWTLLISNFFVSLVFGGIIFGVSYPLQSFFFKLKTRNATSV